MHFPWKKSYGKPRQHIKKQRHHFANKALDSQSYGFSSRHVWMWELDIKKAEHWRIDAFELWHWRRLLRVPWTARRSSQSILKETTVNIHWKDWCWSWNSNTLATSCKELTHLKRPWCWERLKAGGAVGDRGWDGWMASLTQWTRVWANSGREWRTGKPGVLQSMGSQRVGHDWVTEQQSIKIKSMALHYCTWNTLPITWKREADLCIRKIYWSDQFQLQVTETKLPLASAKR